MSAEPPSTAIDDKFWERLRYRKVPIKKHVQGSLPEPAGSMVTDQLWQSFKQHCAGEGNLVPYGTRLPSPAQCCLKDCQSWSVTIEPAGSGRLPWTCFLMGTLRYRRRSQNLSSIAVLGGSALMRTS